MRLSFGQAKASIPFWEKIGFRIALGILLPLGMSVYALVSLTGFYDYLSGSFDTYSDRKDRIEHTWTSVRLRELEYRVRLAETKYYAERFLNGDRTLQRQKLEKLLSELEVGVREAYKLSGDISRADSRRLYNGIFGTIRYLREYFEQLEGDGRMRDARQIEETRQRFLAITQDLEQSLRRLKARFELYELQDLENIRNEYREIRNDIITKTIFIFVFGLLVCGIVTFSITNPINKVIGRLRDIAKGEGDLTKRVHTRTFGEMRVVAILMNEFLDTIHGIVATIRMATATIAHSVTQVSNQTHETTGSANEINHNMMDQSNSLEDCSVSLARIDDLLQSTSESSRQAASLSRLAMDRALKGGASVQETVGAMEKIEESAKKVEFLVSTINGIATQTNLLAINAAIEASKAGEHGKGFAVVAEEVRKLAERSRTLTVEVTDLIGEVGSRVKTGNSLARGAGVALDGIIKDVEAVASLIQRIAAASTKQTESSSRLLESIQSVNQAVRQNLSSMLRVSQGTEVAQSEVEKLDGMMSQLDQIVHQFKLMEYQSAIQDTYFGNQGVTSLPSVEEVAQRSLEENVEMSSELHATYLPDQGFEDEEGMLAAEAIAPPVELRRATQADLPMAPRENSNFTSSAPVDAPVPAPMPALVEGADSEEEFEIDPEDTLISKPKAPVAAAPEDQPAPEEELVSSESPTTEIPRPSLQPLPAAALADAEQMLNEEDDGGFFSADELSKEIFHSPDKKEDDVA